MKTKNLYSIFKMAVIVFADIVMSFLACILSHLLFAGLHLELNQTNFIIFTLITVGLSIIFFSIFHLYSSVWRYAGEAELAKVGLATICITSVNVIIMFITRDNGESYVPIRVGIVTGFILFLFTILVRFSFRLLRLIRSGHFRIIVTKAFYRGKEKVMIVGAGDAGVALLKELENPALNKMYAVCAIDDDVDKIGKRVLNVKVVGGRDKIVEAAKKYQVDKIIIAMPSVNPKEVSNIINICQETKCKILTVPGMYQYLNENVTLRSLRNVEIKDLLGREQIVVNLEEINGYLKQQVVLVSGGGGSIGSELCRQIVKSDPKKLIIVDIYENNAYEIEQELRRQYPSLDLLVLIASVRDKNKIDNIFNKYRPNIVIHAAAHKHVPLMETSPNEAIKNNVFGTLNMAQMSDKYGVKRFILISTDKAVNPTNVMGATKRICEMIIQTINKKSNTEFVAVRFGNVLGSNGSVIPLFKKQIQEGGPVTVTHENITRFFMTIPEAVSLVLQAGSYAKGGEIFVLDMGEPVRIYDLAVNLIRLSGLTPNVDIEIKITGLRPGEKLYEEILMDEEGLKETPNKLIHIGQPIKLDEENLFINLNKIYEAAYNETDNMKELIKEIVPTYNPKQ